MTRSLRQRYAIICKLYVTWVNEFWEGMGYLRMLMLQGYAIFSGTFFKMLHSYGCPVQKFYGFIMDIICRDFAELWVEILGSVLENICKYIGITGNAS